jgi:hypothetical protein
MLSIVRIESSLAIHHPKSRSKMHCSPAPISTKALGTIAVKILKIEIQRRMILHQHEAVGADAKSPITYLSNLLFRRGQCKLTIVNHYKIVTCCLVFVKMNARHVEDL